MIHPSYFELMDVVNQGTPAGEEPIVTSRYSIVLGTAKRARQIIAASGVEGSPELESNPLSMAVDQIMDGTVHILPAKKETPETESTEEWAEEEPAENE